MPPKNKYIRTIKGIDHGTADVDVYAVLAAFDVTCPARQHAIKKLLCAGIRGKGNAAQDLTEAGQAVDRAIGLEGHHPTTAPPDTAFVEFTPATQDYLKNDDDWCRTPDLSSAFDGLGDDEGEDGGAGSDAVDDILSGATPAPTTSPAEVSQLITKVAELQGGVGGMNKKTVDHMAEVLGPIFRPDGAYGHLGHAGDELVDVVPRLVAYFEENEKEYRLHADRALDKTKAEFTVYRMDNPVPTNPPRVKCEQCDRVRHKGLVCHRCHGAERSRNAKLRTTVSELEEQLRRAGMHAAAMTTAEGVDHPGNFDPLPVSKIGEPGGPAHKDTPKKD